MTQHLVFNGILLQSIGSSIQQIPDVTSVIDLYLDKQIKNRTENDYTAFGRLEKNALEFPIHNDVGDTDMASQRISGFKGDLQRGTIAYDRDSNKLDEQVRTCRDKLQEHFPKLTMVKKLSKSEKIRLVGDDCFSFVPDGGCWFKDKTLIAVFEAKKQGRQGNAHERW